MAETAKTQFDLIKDAIGITGNYQDDTLLPYVEDVKDYMKSAGVSEEIIEANSSVGVIARGVMDLWNYNAGAGKLSQYFYERLCQLTYVTPPNPEEVD